MQLLFKVSVPPLSGMQSRLDWTRLERIVIWIFKDEDWESNVHMYCVTFTTFKRLRLGLSRRDMHLRLAVQFEKRVALTILYLVTGWCLFSAILAILLLYED